jgi:hypothetical protein
MNLAEKFKNMFGRPRLPLLLGRIEELPKADWFYDDGEARPTADTINRAEEILLPCIDRLTKLELEDADVHPERGSIRIIWTHGAKTLKLVIPATASPYLYCQDGDEYHASEQVSSSMLAEHLEWLSATAPC